MRVIRTERYGVPLLGGAGVFCLVFGLASLVVLVEDAPAVRHFQATAGTGFEANVRWLITFCVTLAFFGIGAVLFEARQYQMWKRRDPGPLGHRVLRIIETRGGQASLEEVCDILYAEDHKRGAEHESLSSVLRVTCSRLPWLGLLVNTTPDRSPTDCVYRITDAGVSALR